jgi:CheY-like chemotaxis protein
MSKLYNVLCINDNEVTLWIQNQTIKKTLSNTQVHTFLNGKEGLDFCKTYINSDLNIESFYPRLIFLDLHMPLLDGWEFLDCFTREYWPYFKKTKIVICSYSNDRKHIEKAKNYPFVIDFLHTPLNTDYLIDLAKSSFPSMLNS